jgi:predicted molibdopterin-dependent oxidoreductase YjgC
MEGAVFAPFHYGSWDLDALYPGSQTRQANELTMTIWDPVSKQPIVKTAACRVTKVRDGNGPAPTTTASRPAGIPATQGGESTTSATPATPSYPNNPALGDPSPAPTATIAGSA